MATVSSVLWESTTMISSAQATESRQAAMLEDSLRVMTVTVSFTLGSVQDRDSGARELGSSGVRGFGGWGRRRRLFFVLLPSSFFLSYRPATRPPPTGDVWIA